MGKSRRKIPENKEIEVLFLQNHTCCICRNRGNDVQIHHIDGDHSNNDVSNLTLVCLNCHSLVTGKRGLGQSYKPGEVYRYKINWERKVRDLRTFSSSRHVLNYQKEIISQIDLIICKILVSNNIEEAKRNCDLLYGLHAYRGNNKTDKKIIEGLEYLVPLISSELMERVARLLWQMCFQFEWPVVSRMDVQSLKIVIRCIKALGSLLYFNCSGYRNTKNTDVIIEKMEKFLLVGIGYSKSKIIDTILKQYPEALEGCFLVSPPPFNYNLQKLEFRYGFERISKSLSWIKEKLSESPNKWNKQKQKINVINTIFPKEILNRHEK